MAVRRTEETREAPVTRAQAVRSLLMGVGSVALTGVLILTLVATVVLAVFGPAAPLVTVPEVAGQPQQEAEDRLKAARLTMKVVNSAFSTEVKEGSVVSMSPYAGKIVRAGREVRVAVSRGGRVARAPKLAGLTLAEAKDKLAERDLQLGEVERKTSDEPGDIILAQDPPPGKVMPRKAKVNLVVSGGKGFDEYKVGEHKYVFRALKVIVSQGKMLQLVQVDVSGEGEEQSFYERLCKPGEVVRVDLYGPSGGRVRVRIEDETVYSARL
jgi:beta-lactam-binding protein with PASTA domain